VALFESDPGVSELIAVRARVERLAAVGKRLDTMLQVVGIVSTALNNLYGTLSDEQKARFEAIGPQQTSQLETLEVAPTTSHRHRYGRPSVEQIIRRLMYRL